MSSSIDKIADLLLREGHVDNKTDARLAAIDILLAAERLRRLPVGDCGGGDVAMQGWGRALHSRSRAS